MIKREDVWEDGSCKGCGWIVDASKNSLHIGSKKEKVEPCHKCLREIVVFSNKVWRKTTEEDAYIVVQEEDGV